jgi:signal transduction histidine kinase
MSSPEEHRRAVDSSQESSSPRTPTSLRPIAPDADDLTVLERLIDELNSISRAEELVPEVLRLLAGHVGLDAALLQSRRDGQWRVLGRIGGSSQGGASLAIPSEFVERVESGQSVLGDTERTASWLSPLVGHGAMAAGAILVAFPSLFHGDGILVGVSATAAGAERASERLHLLRRCLAISAARVDALSMSAELTRRGGAVDDLVAERAREVARKLEIFRQADANLLQAQKLEAISQLAGSVAHDFNNVLGTIVGTSDLLLMEPITDPQLKEGLELVRDAGLRATELTRRLLTFTRKRALQRQVLDLGQIVEELAPTIQRLLGERIALRLSLSPGTPLVRAERSQFEQVLLNLTLNAGDALPNGGTVTLSLDKLEGTPSGVGPSGNWVRLVVSDDGTGIAPAQLPRVFEPFFTTKDPAIHAGLGLSTVWGIMKHHEGHVSARADEGHGSSFIILLPPAH